MINPAQLRELQDILREVYGLVLDDAAAMAMGEALLKLFGIISSKA